MSHGEDVLLRDLLEKTSRTFALAIPLLPQPTQRQVTLAYLLLRIADTIEDGVYLSQHEKLAGLEQFAALLRQASRNAGPVEQLEFPRSPSENAHYLQLLEELPLVVGALRRIDPEARATILRCVETSLAGMQRFVAAGTHQGVQLQSRDELHDYCYAVAGVVGEMLTDLFVLGAPWLAPMRSDLHTHARWFGEGLQLVNILKDSEEDERAGRRFTPRHMHRRELTELALEDLHRAEAYLSALKHGEAPAGVIAFTELPLRLAWRTLECVEANGPGSKIPKAEVLSLLAQTLYGATHSADDALASEVTAR